MLSVLIPIYNYNVVDLVTSIHNQLTDCTIPFEIICMDDASATEFISINRQIESLEFTTFIKSNTNKGRTKTRQLLSNASKYDWLLFLDADTLPVENTFISSYISQLNSGVEAIFGGIIYSDHQPNSDYMLRWKYGIKYESQSDEIRNLSPFKNIVSANMCMKKDVFNSINSSINYNAYGLDNYFGAKLKENNSKIAHINNPVYHLGLESNRIYLLKKEEATRTLLRLIKENTIKNSDNKILFFFQFSKKTQLNRVFSYLYKVLNTQMKNNLLSSNPSLRIFQFYRIAYMCYADLNISKY